MLGYMLLGAGWLIFKNEGALRDWAYQQLPRLVLAVSGIFGVAFVVAMTVDLSVELAQSGQRLNGWELIWPLLGVSAMIGLVLSSRLQRDWLPFALTVVFFLAAYLTLGSVMWPYLVPYSLTVADAAAPESSLQFIFYGGVVVLPVIALYSIIVYWVFRGKIDPRLAKEL